MNTATLISDEATTLTPTRKFSNNFKSRRSRANYSDQDLLEGIKNRDNKTLEFIYDQCYPMIRDLVLKQTGNQEDAQDIFQDAMVIIYNKVKQDDLVLFCAFKTYLYSVCRRISLKYLEQRKRAGMINREMPKPIELPVESPLEAYEEEVEKYNIFQQHLLELKEDARQLLKLYMDNYSFKEISSIMGYKSENYAKTRKYAFKEELKKRILEDPYYRKFYEACA
jgi:RNA polymerase sigma factor (sigma-70 family)